MKRSNGIKLIISIVLCVSLGSVGGLVTVNEIPTWYATLNKPSFNPPNWLFGPVWTTLYVLMGISVYLIWKQPVSTERNKALQLFILQFILNFCWSFIFFGLHATGWALMEMIALWILILLSILHFAKHSKTAAWLLVPYIAWVSFALLLNAAIWRLN
ncbi:MAG: tryptophan-rich sensory protein [Sediminibacterium sp. Gen4]|jgi:translocator protein|uniref:TspO/MBR family protein n=1 Tax=unclassified Sediminibacterium TaxID=2635961 RepID=UPI0015BACE36|nr:MULTISPECIES: TspO/MBR family protein [unclassified Sediminibacterium]NWK64994.1 tryptophan-rich sensory protein [Sediminibacterium sp. Gen4]